MNIEAMREHLAVKVMGWELIPETDSMHGKYEDPTKYDPEYASDEQSYECLDYKWLPDENIEQAMMVLDTFKTWCCEHPYTEYRVMINSHSVAKEDGRAIEKTLPLAICIAASRATGLEVE